jgi:hypothetical protein
MKKVILIEDNSYWYEIFKGVFDQMQISYFPKTKCEFDILRSSFSVVLTPRGEYIQSHQDKRIEQVTKMLADYIDGTKDRDIFCICDYQLFENKPSVNGINFYKKFLGDEKPVIFVSATSDRDEITSIEYFCSEKPNREFFRKDQRIGCVLTDKEGSEREQAKFEKALAEKVTTFLEN